MGCQVKLGGVRLTSERGVHVTLGPPNIGGEGPATSCYIVLHSSTSRKCRVTRGGSLIACHMSPITRRGGTSVRVGCGLLCGPWKKAGRSLTAFVSSLIISRPNVGKEERKRLRATRSSGYARPLLEPTNLFVERPFPAPPFLPSPDLPRKTYKGIGDAVVMDCIGIHHNLLEYVHATTNWFTSCTRSAPISKSWKVCYNLAALVASPTRTYTELYGVTTGYNRL